MLTFYTAATSKEIFQRFLFIVYGALGCGRAFLGIRRIVVVSKNELVHLTFAVCGELSIPVDTKVLGIRKGAFSAAISIGMLSITSMYAGRMCTCVEFAEDSTFA